MLDDIMFALRIRADHRNSFKFIMAGLVLIFIFYHLNFLPTLQSNQYFQSAYEKTIKTCKTADTAHLHQSQTCKYVYKYPLSPVQETSGGKSFRIAAIADLDAERSKVSGDDYKWRSYIKYGHLTQYRNGKFSVTWDDQYTLTSKLNEKGRGFELSELCVFNGKLYTVDDRTGIVYHLHNTKEKTKPVPWVILQDGDGLETKGFKGEWMTVKDGALYVGGLGKEWTTKEGTFINYHPLFVKSISPDGHVVHHNWTDNYLKIRAKAGVRFPGYMIHEAVMWSTVKRRWYFLPRRMSTLKYNDVEDERHGTNVLISCDVNFDDVTLVRVGKLDPTHGFSSFKFVPGSGDDIAVALKSREVDNEISSFIMVFNVETGNVLLPETKVDNEKFEGVEFI